MSFEAMQAQFEGREAIYVEQGALRVRISDISWDTAKLVVAAKIEEIPTPGLPAGCSVRPKAMSRILFVGASRLATQQASLRTPGIWAMVVGPYFSPRS
jgi:hypothetical protein